MPHKITLTGKATSSLRCEGDVCTFDMRESGSPSPPKGLPSSTEITYTVFVSKKQLQKAGMTEETIKNEHLFIQGEPTLDIPIDQCPGEVAVIAFQLQIIEKKEKEVQKDQKKEKEPTIMLKGTTDFLNLDEIVIPEEFLNASPRREKVEGQINYFKKHRVIDEPLLIDPETKILQDGYTRYIAAKEMNEEKVPVRYAREGEVMHSK